MSLEAPSLLQCAQATHETKIHLQHDHGFMIVMGSSYTRHVLARQISLISDAKSVVLGNVRLNNVNALNRRAVKLTTNAMK